MTQEAGTRMEHRRKVFAITGADRESFLQGLVTNDVRALAHGPVHAALLTPQGKYLADFLLIGQDGRILLDIAEPLASATVQRLAIYRLRADVAITETDLKVRRGTGDAPAGAVQDPRHPALGWRLYGDEEGDDGTDFTALRIAHAIPESAIELIPGESYILEAGFERLNGVDFRKGCYVGQEVTARMKHKTDLRKGLVRVRLDGPVPEPGTPVMAGDRAIGTLFTARPGCGLAHLRLDQTGETMQAGAALVWRDTSDPTR
jgi:tRNA-modifying protein YgfZ